MSANLAQAEELFSDRRWRLNNLYVIKNKAGIAVPFRMNPAQEQLLDQLHNLNIILKARQMGFCLAPDTRVLTADLRWVPIAELTVGEEIVAVDEHVPGGKGQHRKMRTAEIQGVVQVEREAYRITFDDGRSVVCTGKHPWLSRKAGPEGSWRTIESDTKKKLLVGTQVRWVTKPWADATAEDGWFGGMLDGEGSIAKSNSAASLNVSQRRGAVWDRLEAYCAERAYSYRVESDQAERPGKHGKTPVPKIVIGRMDEMFRAIGQCRPTRFVGNRFWEGRELPGKRSGIGWATITNIEKLGTRTLIDLQTSTGTYIAEGFVSHNTTLIQMMMLDACLFNSNTSAGIVAHNREDAEAFFDDKIKFAYDQLDPELKKVIRAEQDSAKSLTFSNGSRIRVGTSLRSGTFQYLHVSEFGKTCAQFPAKAKEIVTGAFNAVEAGQFIAVESTAEGQGGYFHDMVMEAKKHAEMRRELTTLDFKLHFFPWWQDPSYALSDSDAGKVTLTDAQEKYFDELAHKHEIELTPGQEAWYVKKLITQRDEMKREYPATVEEAFEASIEGAYLSEQMQKVRREGRICRIPVEAAPVDTFWDLGVNDDMVIWFRQKIGPEHRFIDYYSNSGEGLEHYARILKEKAAEHRYVYGTHYLPHDGKHRRLGYQTKSVAEMLAELRVQPVQIVPRIASEKSGVEHSRTYLARCWFDEAKTTEGIRCLDNYRKEWDDERGVFKDRPRHDWASHGYKGFETAAVNKEFDGEEDYYEGRDDDRGRNSVTGY